MLQRFLLHRGTGDARYHDHGVEVVLPEKSQYVAGIGPVREPKHEEETIPHVMGAGWTSTLRRTVAQQRPFTRRV